MLKLSLCDVGWAYSLDVTRGNANFFQGLASLHIEALVYGTNGQRRWADGVFRIRVIDGPSPVTLGPVLSWSGQREHDDVLSYVEPMVQRVCASGGNGVYLLHSSELSINSSAQFPCV